MRSELRQATPVNHIVWMQQNNDMKLYIKTYYPVSSKSLQYIQYEGPLQHIYKNEFITTLKLLVTFTMHLML